MGCMQPKWRISSPACIRNEVTKADPAPGPVWQSASAPASRNDLNRPDLTNGNAPASIPKGAAWRTWLHVRRHTSWRFAIKTATWRNLLKKALSARLHGRANHQRPEGLELCLGILHERDAHVCGVGNKKVLVVARAVAPSAHDLREVNLPGTDVLRG